MFIKSVIIDGFKSYAQRTEIAGWDEMFNAITGLNGSGKSNILDAICFVLGISNLSQVRATNLQELVYKSGQAGITKATVSICFDNRNKKQSPMGYEHYDEITITRQVVVGGRNKYLINGSNATNNRVVDFFCSVQLNVNNPHFLIMQGRITKVLNMKPPEILSMIEEAAGTRMYEAKRIAALKTIEKKDAKLAEINTILDEEITPKLATLKQERSAYLEFQKVQRELEHLSRFSIAFQFCEAKERHKLGGLQAKEKEENIKRLGQRIDTNQSDIERLTGEIHERELERDKDGQLHELEAELKERQKLEAKATSSLQSKQDSLKGEEKKRKDHVKHREEDKKALVSKQEEWQTYKTNTADVESRGTTDAEEVERAQRRLQAVISGLSTNEDGEEATLANQLLSAKQEISTAQTEIKQAEMKIKHLQPELRKKEAEVAKSSGNQGGEKQNFDKLKGEVSRLENELKKLKFDEALETSLTHERRTIQPEMNNLRGKLEQLQGRFPNLHFDYRDPERNFDRSRVKGLVARLISVKDRTFATALEVAAGGKLYNVVVDNESTGKLLLQKGELKRRVTIIPLNKIAGGVINQNIVNRAKTLVGHENAHLALSMVGFDEEIQSAMEFVFGNAFLCTNMDAAKKVTFNDSVMKKSVTLAGEMFDPQGTLTGGSRSQVGSVLEQLYEFGQTEQNFEKLLGRSEELDNQLGQMQRVGQQYRQVKQQLELKQRETELAQTAMEQTTYHQLVDDVNKIRAEIEECRQAVIRANTVKAKAEQKVADLELKMNNAGAYREKEMKDAEKHLKEMKKRAENSGKLLAKQKQGAESLQLEIAELEKGIEGYGTQLEATEEAIAQYKSQISELTAVMDEAKKEVAKLEAEVHQLKEALKAKNRDIAAKQSELEAKRKDCNKAELKIKELRQEIDKEQREGREAGKRVEQLLANYDWIPGEEKFFGQKNTAYDFDTVDAKEVGRRIVKLQESKEKLSKNVNMRAMNMLGKAEEQYEDLLKKKEIVEKDKEKISQVIVELDQKKKEAIEKAWEQVNKDFGSIYGTLLPGASARLSPPAGQTALDGLEVRVAFGGVWKDSLAELSGGQRSLVALSLILAMLLFKPAPIYILDEVDAALDLSHTQNIGHLIRTHFHHSQFIVVSLKDGMFNNANVLFKTKFIDGVSTVTRQLQRQPSHQPLAAIHNSVGASRQKKKKRLNDDDE